MSTPLVSMLQEITEGQKTIEVVITLNDTTGIRALFPSLTIANPHVALGHLTIDEIFSLCSLNGVTYIDKPRISYPQ